MNIYESEERGHVRSPYAGEAIKLEELRGHAERIRVVAALLSERNICDDLTGYAARGAGEIIESEVASLLELLDGKPAEDNSGADSNDADSRPTFTQICLFKELQQVRHELSDLKKQLEHTDGKPAQG